MTYRIARNGEIYGPYTLTEVQQYMTSGNIAASDLVQGEGSAEWLPVTQVFPLASVAEAPVYAGGLPVLYPDPPDLPWWVALLLGLFTGFAFFVIWDLVQAAWLRRVNKASNALWVYIAVAVVYGFRAPGIWHTVYSNVTGNPDIAPGGVGVFSGAGFALFLISRYLFRSELLEHFNSREPIGLQLNPVLTLLGGLYFQYKFNHINRIKRALQVSVPAL